MKKHDLSQEISLVNSQAKDSENLSEIVIRKLKKLWREKKGTTPPNYEDTTANGLTKCIIHYLELKGYQAERINCFGRPIPNGDGSYRMGETTMDKGTSDISSTVKGISLKVEVKIGNDKMSSFQWEYKRKIENAGGVYIVARSFPGFLIELHEKVKM